MKRLLLILATVGCSETVTDAPCSEGTVLVGTDCVRTCQKDAECLLSERCDHGQCVAISATEPVAIRAFEASAYDVSPGSSVRLEWVVVNATSIDITNAPAVTSELSGSVDTEPLMKDTVFLLTARNGNDEERRSLTVNVPSQLKVDHFSVVDVAEQPCVVEFSWRVVDDSGSPIEVSIIDEGGDTVLSGLTQRGAQTYRLDQENRFRLRALGSNSIAESEFVTAQTNGICSFAVRPQSMRLLEGDTAVLTWNVHGSGSMILRQAGRTLVENDLEPGGSKGMMVVRPTTGNEYILEKLTTDGQHEFSESISIPVDPQPPFVTFSGTPKVFQWTALGSQDVVVEWRFSNTLTSGTLTRQVMDAANEPPGEQFTASSGQRSFTVDDTYEVRIAGVNSSGSTEETIRVWALVPETNNNGRLNPDWIFASSLTTNGPNRFGRSGTVGDIATDVADWYQLQVAAGQLLDVSVLANCSNQEVTLEIHPPNNGVPSSVTSEGAWCPSFRVRDTSAGIYKLKLSSSRTFHYGLVANPHFTSCGDGIVEDEEECDDGNSSGGDGCSSACTWEAIHRYQVETAGGMLSPPPMDALLLHFVRYSDPVLELIQKEGCREPNDCGSVLLELPRPIQLFGHLYRAIEIHSDGFFTFLPLAIGDPTPVLSLTYPLDTIAGEVRVWAEQDGSLVVDFANSSVGSDGDLNFRVRFNGTRFVFAYGGNNLLPNTAVYPFAKDETGTINLGLPTCSQLGCTIPQNTEFTFRLVDSSGSRL